MQVRIGLWNLTSPANRIRNDKEFMALFPSKQSEWYLRMAVLYSFAAGAGWTSAFLRTYKNQLLALPEGQRHFLVNVLGVKGLSLDPLGLGV